MTRADAYPSALGNMHGPVYAAARRIEAILDEAVISGALTPIERRSVGLYVRDMRAPRRLRLGNPR